MEDLGKGNDKKEELEIVQFRTIRMTIALGTKTYSPQLSILVLEFQSFHLVVQKLNSL
jgi:hypothetical protein